jgi:hypothetical protein
MKIRKSLVVLRHGLFKAGEKLILRTARIARLEREFLWTVGHTKGCLMGLVEAARGEITGLSVVILMLSRKQQKNERKRSESQARGQLGRREKLAVRKSRLYAYRTFRELHH